MLACHLVKYASAGPCRIFVELFLCVFRQARPSSVTNLSRGLAGPRGPYPRLVAFGKFVALVYARLLGSSIVAHPPNTHPASLHESPFAASFTALPKCVPLS